MPRHIINVAKLVVAYVALVLGLSTFTELLIWTLCAFTHEPGSGDVQTVKLAYNVDPGKTAPTVCRLIIQVQLSNVNVCPLNTLIFTPTAPSRISLFGLPLARTILPYSLALPLDDPVLFLTGTI